jgi:hypothetical protein
MVVSARVGVARLAAQAVEKVRQLRIFREHASEAL